MTDSIISKAVEREYEVFSPRESHLRGGAISLGIPHAFQVKQALNSCHIKVDYRRGREMEPDVIRIGPHFYTDATEIDELFERMDEIFAKESYRQYPSQIDTVT